MKLSVSAIAEFKNLYRKKYEKKLTTAQAVDLGTKLVLLVKTVYGANTPKEWKPERIDSSEAKKVL